MRCPQDPAVPRVRCYAARSPHSAAGAARRPAIAPLATRTRAPRWPTPRVAEPRPSHCRRMTSLRWRRRWLAFRPPGRSWNGRPTMASRRAGPPRPVSIPRTATDGSDASDASAALEAFSAARACFATIEGWLAGPASDGLEHGELEQQLDTRGRELLRLLFQDHVDLRALREGRLKVADAGGSPRTRVEIGHARGLATIFGEVTVTRLAYREPGQANLYPADAVLNLPTEKHSHGLRQLAAIESSRGSFDAAVEAIERGTGQHLGKRQVEDLASRAGIDFDAFYLQRPAPTGEVGDVLVLSCDGKGVVMRPGSLRAATAKAAASTNPKLATRLSKGEKRGRKRMAEVGAVYDITPISRCPADVLPGDDTQREEATAGPNARNKWLTASVVDDAGGQPLVACIRSGSCLSSLGVVDRQDVGGAARDGGDVVDRPDLGHPFASPFLSFGQSGRQLGVGAGGGLR